jgi:hypothetical protein
LSDFIQENPQIISAKLVASSVKFLSLLKI